jgi:hypothetical protein
MPAEMTDNYRVRWKDDYPTQERYGTIVTRSDLIEALKQFTQPTLDVSGLAEWALQRFHAVEQGRDTIDEQDRQELMSVLDELMFADQEPFVISAADAARLIDQLTKP